MSAFLLRRLSGLALVLALALATSGAAVAHRLALGAPEQEALAVYLALGGKLSALCGDGHPAPTHCDACRPLHPAAPPGPFRLAAARAPAPLLFEPSAAATPPRSLTVYRVFARGPPEDAPPPA